jgi:hypothetical protein
MSWHQGLRPARLRAIVVAAVLAVTGLLVSTSQIASAHEVAAADTGGAKPVIVLEHGAWADGSSWQKVVRILQGDGYTVYVPPNPLRGVAADSAYLNDFLTQNANLAGKPVVLVGHSYGGFVITNDPGGLFAARRARCSIRAVLVAMILPAAAPFSLVPAAEWVCHVHAACPVAGAGSADRCGDRGDVRFPEDGAAAGGGDPGPAGPVAGR